MNRINLKSVCAAALMGSAMMAAAPALSQTTASSVGQMAVQPLMEGESLRAIALLEAELAEHPSDPALQINLGIAYAQSGNDEESRRQFEAAMANREVSELETANGRVIDSQRLARLALAMLERGEFAPARRAAGQLTLRDD